MPGEAGQQPGAPGAQAGQESAPAGGEGTVEGCLGMSAGNFTVTDKSGTSYRLNIPATADASKLSQHVGEEVRVTGALTGAGQPSGAEAASSASASGAASAAGGQPSIAVTKVDKIGDKCNSNAQKPASK